MRFKTTRIRLTLVFMCSLLMMSSTALAQTDEELEEEEETSGNQNSRASNQDNEESSSNSSSSNGNSSNSSMGLNTDDLEPRFVDRSLVAPKMTLRILHGPSDHRTMMANLYRGTSDYGFGTQTFGVKGFTAPGGFEVDGDLQTNFVFRLGAAFTPIENLEVGIGFPFRSTGFTRGTRIGRRAVDDIPTWVTYQFLSTDSVDIGVRLTMFLPSYHRFGMQLALPVMIRAGDMLRIDTGLFTSVAFWRNDPNNDSLNGAVGRLSIPARFSFQVTDELFVGFTSGIDFPDFGGIAVPLGWHVGYTLDLDVALVDFGFSMTWPAAIVSDFDGSDASPGANIRGLFVANRDEPGDFNDFDFNFGANASLQF